jgi:hypothetical protein
MNLPKSRSTTLLLALAVIAFAGCGDSSDSSNQLNGVWSGHSAAICPERFAFSSWTEFHVNNDRLTEVFCDSEPLGVTGQFTARKDNLFRLSLSTGETAAFYSDGEHAAMLVSYGSDEYGMGVLQRGATPLDPPGFDPLDRFDPSGTWAGRTITIDENLNPASTPYGRLEISRPLVGQYEFQLEPDSGDAIEGIILPQSPTVSTLVPFPAPMGAFLHYIIPTNDGLFAGALRIPNEAVETDSVFELEIGFWTKQ